MTFSPEQARKFGRKGGLAAAKSANSDKKIAGSSDKKATVSYSTQMRMMKVMRDLALQQKTDSRVRFEAARFLLEWSGGKAAPKKVDDSGAFVVKYPSWMTPENGEG